MIINDDSYTIDEFLDLLCDMVDVIDEHADGDDRVMTFDDWCTVLINRYNDAIKEECES
jgi:uncharacterized protein with von Willebrand factor type A (vWA) domain